MQAECNPVVADSASQAHVMESRNPQEPLTLFLQAGLADLQVSLRPCNLGPEPVG
jgi:hypothetical protein